MISSGPIILEYDGTQYSEAHFIERNLIIFSWMLIKVLLVAEMKKIYIA